MSKAEYEAAYSLACANPGPVSREIARQQIAAGRLRGYLAYDESVSIGWCNVNDKAGFLSASSYSLAAISSAAESSFSRKSSGIFPSRRGSQCSASKQSAAYKN